MKSRIKLILLMSIALGASICRAQVAETSKMNVLLVTVDTLRADHLGCYGYRGAETPNIDRLASQGTKFDRVYAQVPFTLPSHASMFTSTYPMWNGVRDSAGPPLAEDLLTIAEVFKQNGYATAGFPAAFVLDGFFRLNQGFDFYYDNFPARETVTGSVAEEGLSRRGGEQLEHVLKWLGDHGNKKFFVWAHFYDPHHPYDPPEPFASRFRTRRYDGEIAYVDSVIGKLLRFLNERGLSDKTLIVLTADHGEGLGEHNELYHGYYVYNSTLQVPLVIFGLHSDRYARDVATPVMLLDLAPTILDLVGIPIPKPMQGRSLLASMLGKTQKAQPIYAESLFANLHFGWGTLYSLRVGPYKLIQSKRPELFDLGKDSREASNAYAGNSAVANTIRGELEGMAAKFARERPVQPPPRMSQDALEKLRALGYIGGPSDASPRIGDDLPDPKDKLPLYNLYLQAAALQGQGKLRQAAAVYQQILVQDSKPVVVHHQLGSVYFKLGEYPQAVESFKAALKLNPRADASVLALARTYGEMGKLQEALVGYERALALSPDDPATLNNLAVIQMKVGTWDKAIESLERATRHPSPPKETYYHLGVCYQRQQRLEDAAAQFRRAIERDPRFAAAHYNLGTVYARQGKGPAAMAAFREALAARPDFAEAYFNLGSLLSSQNDLPAGAAEFKKAIKVRPAFAEAHFNLGTVYARQGLWDDAIAEYKKAIAARPEFAQAYRGLALMYQQKGVNEESAAAMRRAETLAQKRGPGVGGAENPSDVEAPLGLNPSASRQTGERP